MHLQMINNGKANAKPILLKIAPDHTPEQIDDVVDLALEIKLDGLVASNTTINRSGLATSAERLAAIATRLAQEGASIVIADLVRENAEATASALCEAGWKAHAVQVDVTVPEQVRSLMHSTLKAFGRLDVLVNNAGVGLNKSFLQTSLEEWERTLRINLTGTFLCSQAAAWVMTENGGGKIINIASISGERGAQNRSAYGASKAGVIQLTRVMALVLV